MMRLNIHVSAVGLTLLIVACSAPAGEPSLAASGSEEPAASVSPSPAAPATPAISHSPPKSLQPSPSDQPTADAAYRVTYGWAVPSTKATVPHDVHVPIAPPPALPLPALVAIAVDDQSSVDPAFQRISFSFTGAFPEYNVQYVRVLTDEGSGDAIPLAGNGVLRIGFVHAQAHDDAGASTVSVSPNEEIGFQNLVGFGFAGDVGGHLTYGLGIHVAPASDQVLRVRAGEQVQPGGTDGMLYVVHIDLERG